MNEVRKSAVWALATSIPITTVCWYFSWALIHAEDATRYIAGAFLAPAWGLTWMWEHFNLGDAPYVFLPLALLAQVIGYFVVTYLVRQSLRKMRTRSRLSKLRNEG